MRRLTLAISTSKARFGGKRWIFYARGSRQFNGDGASDGLDAESPHSRTTKDATSAVRTGSERDYLRDPLFS
jgi:hypothetical protein